MSSGAISGVELIEANSIPEPNSGCWLWLNTPSNNGYGRIMFCSKHYMAHRFSYLMYRGAIPNGLFVCHVCDIKTCVNPDHLWLGTSADNVHDCTNKGRMFTRYPPHIGVAAREMLRAGILPDEVAEAVGISREDVMVLRKTISGVQPLPKAQYCKNGHPLFGGNLLLHTPKTGKKRGNRRICRTCRDENLRRFHAKKSAVI